MKRIIMEEGILLSWRRLRSNADWMATGVWYTHFKYWIPLSAQSFYGRLVTKQEALAPM